MTEPKWQPDQPRVPSEEKEAVKELNLRALLSYDNPKRHYIDGLIRGVSRLEQTHPWSTTYTQDWLEDPLGQIDQSASGRYDKEIIPLFKNHLAGRPLIDLGSGNGSIKLLARIVKVSHYIGVNKFARFGDDAHPEWEYPEDPFVDCYEKSRNERGLEGPKTEEGGLRDMLVKADMLDFISRLPNNYGDFIVNGIDELVISNEEYHRALAEELARVVRKDGIVFGACSEVFQFLDPNIFEELKTQYFEDLEKKIEEEESYGFGDEREFNRAKIFRKK